MSVGSCVRLLQSAPAKTHAGVRRFRRHMRQSCYYAFPHVPCPGVDTEGEKSGIVQTERQDSRSESVPVPLVSICTPTYNRQHLLPLLAQCIAEQSYPKDRLEWIVLDDSDNGQPSFAQNELSGVVTRYWHFRKKMKQGRKRNLSHTLSRGDIIVYMDDDDYYPPERVSHAVERLLSTKALVAGSTYLPIHFVKLGQTWISGPFDRYHATAGTFAFRRELLATQSYEDEAESAEESFFLNKFSVPLVQLDPAKTILCMEHGENTFDKNKLLQAGENERMRRVSSANRARQPMISEDRLRQYAEVFK
jgi:hypothetical protein